jgi:HNH endonuclease/AP2 domain
MTELSWWTEVEFAVVKQELARPTFRRSALMHAQARYRRQERSAVKRGVPFPPFHEWVPQGVRRSDGRLTQEIVRELLDYDPLTGALTWRDRGRHWFRSDRDCDAWNTRHAGKPVGSADSMRKGYLSVVLFHRTYQAHRVIFLLMTGHWPADQIDHDNHNRADNRLKNILEATNLQNQRNQTLRNDNTSRRVGVQWRADRGKFEAKIGVKGQTIGLGHFDTFEAACAAREAAERLHGYSKNHGQPKVRP